MVYCTQCVKLERENEDPTTDVDVRAATHHYQWAWGDEGDCCTEHKVGLEQLSQQLSRSISFTPFIRSPPPSEDEDPRMAALQHTIADLRNAVEVRDARIRELEGKNFELETTLAAGVHSTETNL